ncbi:BURP domain-containing protein 3-like [Prosopis cineraria]|uniref:BURP domain-containing protein 3-like n=1 Tax=Prosopis cineraria TaxID=364024 RepID=UPI00240F140E|nr:BURP domain-containing protein 3-like [Prosopis cineraria]
MKYPLQPIVAFLIVALVTHAALSPELYWKSMLPSTPMPKFIVDLLHPAVNAASSDSTTVHSGRVELETRLCNFRVCYADSGYDTKLHSNPNTTLFFWERDLKAGRRMNFLFTLASNQASFLPREVVKSIPFSSSKMAEILNKFAVKPG